MIGECTPRFRGSIVKSEKNNIIINEEFEEENSGDSLSKVFFRSAKALAITIQISLRLASQTSTTSPAPLAPHLLSQCSRTTR